MPLSPFLMSIAMWGLVFTAFWQQAKDDAAQPVKRPGRRWWRVLAGSFRNLFRQPALAVLLLLLLIPAGSGLWSEDQHYWLERTRVRLPFLVLPWAFANLPRLPQRQSRFVLYGLVWIMVVLAIGVTVHFFLHRTEIMFDMYQGRPMPVPRNHIRFSLMTATAVLAGGWLWGQRFVWRYTWERYVLGGAVVFLFAFIHFLAVRSGLIALYAALLLLAVRWVWRTRRWGLALAVTASWMAVFWLSLQLAPSLKQKWEYTVYDWQQFRSNAGATYSDSERWISLKTGWMLFQEHPLLGVGAGDLPKETVRILEQHFPEYRETPKLPHNQLVYLLAGTGLLGTGLALFALLYPLFVVRHRFFYLFAAFQVMAFTSFLVEYTIETAMGVAWYLFYSLWLMREP